MRTISLTWRWPRWVANAATNPWHIDTGTAQTWVAPSAGHVHVVRGRVWASCDAPSGPAKDHMLLAGERLRVVLASWARTVDDEAWLSWSPS
ncbi:DUF2917 domain-containing protein [Limnohabitans sp.]|uniref:DUF2917 domain-containing protein n=1 Tax=Limnohabitans sp. TaxID=1907725 RepID=UPI00286F13B5|nr:DUF2917 domain-containing protein [Limnohabitans sp.]